MKRNVGAAILFAVAFGLAGCSPTQSTLKLENSASLRPLTEAERAIDFDAAAVAVKEDYGPLDFKQKRFGFEIDSLIAQYRAEALAAVDDDAYTGVLKRFITTFHDGHVSLQTSVQKVSRYTIPLLLTPVENRAIITAITVEGYGAETGIEIGDEVLEVDGVTPQSLMPIFTKYDSLGNDVSDQHLLLRVFSRPSYITELKPTKPTAFVRIAKKNGQILERELTWTLKKGDHYVQRDLVLNQPLKLAFSSKIDEILQANIAQMGSVTPFYYSANIETTFGMTRVKPSDAYLKKYGVEDLTKVPEMWAALYKYDGKTLLLLRMATYAAEDYKIRLSWYKAVLDEYGRFADALVIDQTHNPGGYLSYATGFVSLFGNQTTRGLVNFLHADRRWLDGFGEEANDPKITGEAKNLADLGFKLVEEAYDKGLRMTETPLSIDGLTYLTPADFTFKKPVLMMIDELAGSCGDVVPLLMKTNKLATLFGKRTMGLGGNVEEVLKLPMSQSGLHLTRGTFMVYEPSGIYDRENPTENNGVQPDIGYDHTVDDVRAGYVEYVKAFSKAAAAL